VLRTKIASGEFEMSRMTENEKLCAMYAEGLIEREDVPPSCWHKPRKRKPKTPSLVSAIRKAKAEGMVLTVEPSGAMTFKSIDKVTDHQGNGAILNADDELAQWRKRRGHAHSG
jgi:hypothetical protein